MDQGFTIAYYDKDGSGFCGGDEPWLYGEYVSHDDANDDCERLTKEGFKDVRIIPTPPMAY